ncbi:MAG: phage major capsid protein [Acidimicrobiia bacterium]
MTDIQDLRRSVAAQRDDLIAQRDALRNQARELLGRSGDLEGDDLDAFTRIESELELLSKRLELTDRIASGNVALEYGSVHENDFQIQKRVDPWESQANESAHDVRGRVLTAIERWNADDELKESATETIERLDRGDSVDASRHLRGVAEHVLRYSHPLYIAAFRKYAQDPETFAAELTSDERRAWAEAREYQRATLATSGAVLPSPLDPTIVLTNDGTIDPMRSVARVDSTTAKEKRYITSAGSTFSFDAELAEVSDDTFTETEVTVTTEKAQGWIEASIEAAMDQPNFDAEVAKIIADGKARLEAAKWITGSGTNEPNGIETSLVATEVDAAGEALAADDVYGLLEALPPRFRQNARWQLELSTLNFIARLYNPSGTEPPLIEGGMLLRRPYVENSNIDPYSAVNAAATADNRVLFIGDWSNFVILDRVGLSVHFVGPGVLRGANDRPDGRVGWYAYWRTGSKVLTTSAFRMLNVATTA